MQKQLTNKLCEGHNTSMYIADKLYFSKEEEKKNISKQIRKVNHCTTCSQEPHREKTWKEFLVLDVRGKPQKIITWKTHTKRPN